MISKGWIACDQTDKELLETIGITLGPYRNGAFENCTVPEEAYEKLKVLWGIIFWELEPVRPERQPVAST